MGSFNFKSVGQTREKTIAETVTKTVTPYGIKTPLRLGNEQILETNNTLAEQVADNLRNLLLTNWGERLGLYRFGANLRPLTTELVSLDDFDSQAIDRIRAAVGSWMPYVQLENFVSSVDRTINKNTAVIKLLITYSVPALSITSAAVEISLYAL
jgi:phage baseplate assembly protein W